MTRAAIYARYSSEGQREASIEDQARNCEQHAAREGWTIIKRYKDQAISGTQDEAGRPGFKAMLQDAEARHFEVLLVDDLSRLSRDQIDTERTRRRLVHWGVRLVGVSDGIDTAAKGHKLMSAVKGAMNELFLDDLADKTHRGLTGQALKGYNCGGRTYGYKHVPIYHPTDKDEYGRPRIIAVRREIDPEQARWVRQIFQWYADGHSARWIANELNRLGVPGPSASWRRQKQERRLGVWVANTISGEPRRFTGMLCNPLYIGRYIWNRRQWVRNPETKRKVQRQRPESEWIVTERPDLRIVPQALWERVQARRCEQKQQAPRAGRGPKYLLSGLLKCGECGRNFVMADYYRYGCAGRHYGGPAVCSNALRVPRALVEQRCLEGIRRDLFTPEALTLFVKETTRLLAERRRAKRPELVQTQRRLTEVEREIANLVAAIKKGILTETTKAELEKAEAARTRLKARVQGHAKALDNVVAFLPHAAERYRALVANLGTLSQGHVAEARQQIRELVGGAIKLVPTAQGHLEAELAGHYAGLFKLAVGMKLNNAESPARFHHDAT